MVRKRRSRKFPRRVYSKLSNKHSRKTLPKEFETSSKATPNSSGTPTRTPSGTPTGEWGIKNLRPNRNSTYKQGYFVGAQKYVGPQPIIYRSSYEYRFMVHLELNKKVLKWSSENIQIPYTMKEFQDGKFVEVKHTYNVDFTVWMESGKIVIVEIKPSAFVPLNEAQIKRNPVMYKNACKWRAAKRYCDQNNMVFCIITEKDLSRALTC